MNRRGHGFSLFLALILLASGVPALFDRPASNTPSSWATIYGWLPGWLDWLWPGMFVLSGILALVGVHYVAVLRAAFRFAGLLYLAWGLVGLYGWHLGAGGNIPGSTGNFLIAAALWALDGYVSVGERAANTKQAIRAIKDEAVARANGGPHVAPGTDDAARI